MTLSRVQAQPRDSMTATEERVSSHTFLDGATWTHGQEAGRVGGTLWTFLWCRLSRHFPAEMPWQCKAACSRFTDRDPGGACQHLRGELITGCLLALYAVITFQNPFYNKMLIISSVLLNNEKTEWFYQYLFCYHFISKYYKSTLGSHPGACDVFRSGSFGSWLGLDIVIRMEA